MTVETKSPAAQMKNDHLPPDEENGEDEETELTPSPGEAKKRKKKKKAKKKKATQTDPPRVGLSKLFPSGKYPAGEILEYRDDNAWRTTSEEMRYNERVAMEDPEVTYNNIRRAAEVHRQVRSHARKFIRPGMRLLDIAEEIETSARALVEESGLESAQILETLLVNVVYQPPLWAEVYSIHFIVLSQGDVLKVDFGIHVRGRILDSAFTLTWDHTYDKLLEAVRDATNTGIREAGIDVRLGELAGLIQESIESYEVEVGGKTIPVRPIENFSGHSIKPYRIHGGKSLLLVRNDDPTKMEEGEYFAIETFGSTGRGRAFASGECSHYAKTADAPSIPLRLNAAKGLLRTISKEFGTLTFCRRYLDRIGAPQYLLPLNHLVGQGIVRDYPPLMEERGAMTAQFEHTILLRPTVKEVVSRGDDY